MRSGSEVQSPIGLVAVPDAFENPFIVLEMSFFDALEQEFFTFKFDRGIKLNPGAITCGQILVRSELGDCHAAGRRSIASWRIDPQLVSAVSNGYIPGAQVEFLHMIIAIRLGNTPNFIFETELCPCPLHGAEQ